MATGNGREIISRIKSVKNTKKITNAMGLVASARLTKAKERVELSRPYFQILFSTLNDIAHSNRDFSSPYVKEPNANSPCYIVIAGDRGLAGGYNSNLFQKAQKIIKNEPGTVLPIGKKTVEWCEKNNYKILTTEYSIISQQSISQCFNMSQLLCAEFLKNNFSSIVLLYTNFVSMLIQSPAQLELLPLKYKKDGNLLSHKSSVLYEPSNEEVYNAIVPEYIAGMIYGAICESEASELSARHMAMESATNNANEMLENLNLQYNRIRQSSVTQELTEIVAGAGESL